MYASSRTESARPSVGHVLLVAALVVALGVVLVVTVVMVTPEARTDAGTPCSDPGCTTTVP